MPTHTSALTITSSKEARQQAVSACVAQLVGEGTERERAVLICKSEADRAMGTREVRSGDR